MATAEQLRDLGNKAIKGGDYRDAERYYTKAIILAPKDFKLLTNRALSRLKIKDYPGAALDAEAASAINPTWMKAYRHAAVAYGHLDRHDDAVAAATQAYTICLDNSSFDTRPSSAANRSDLVLTSQLVLTARKARWDFLERQRIVGSHALLNECIDMLWKIQAETEKSLDLSFEKGEIKESERDEGVETAWKEARRKEGELRAMFAKEDPSLKERTRVSAKSEESTICRKPSTIPNRKMQDAQHSNILFNATQNVPDCFIDPISFNFMIDPVITKSGRSYERAHLLTHLERNPSDPLTGEKLTAADLTPNLALREACEAFLNENEWAADF